MRASVLVLGGLTVVGFAATIGMALWAGLPPRLLFALFADAMVTTKLIEMLIVVVMVAAVFIGILHASGKVSGVSGFLAFVTWAGPILGLIGMGLALMIVWIAVRNTHTTNFMVVAPSVAEGLLPLCLGLLTGTVAAGLNRRTAPART